MTAIVRELFAFGLVGSLGFLVDSSILYLVREPLGLYGGRLLSFLAAAGTTWQLNRLFTFRARRSGMTGEREFGIYLVLMLGGGSVNYGVYALLVSRFATVAQHPVLGVAAGSLAGMLANYLLARAVLYRHAGK